MTGRDWNKESMISRVRTCLPSHALRCIHAYRKVQRNEDPLGFYRGILRSMAGKFGLGLESLSIGRGLYLGHPYNIFVGKYAVIGNNCNLNKGVSIGSKTGGDETDMPVLGDRVWVGVNAVIAGRITVGSNVLIAPNAYVDFDVPDNAVVIGNPAQIYSGRGDAVEGYIHNVC